MIARIKDNPVFSNHKTLGSRCANTADIGGNVKLTVVLAIGRNGKGALDIGVDAAIVALRVAQVCSLSDAVDGGIYVNVTRINDCAEVDDFLVVQKGHCAMYRTDLRLTEAADFRNQRGGNKGEKQGKSKGTVTNSHGLRNLSFYCKKGARVGGGVSSNSLSVYLRELPAHCKSRKSLY